MNFWDLLKLAIAITAGLGGLQPGQSLELPPVFVTWNDGRRFTVTPKVARL